MQIQAAGAPPVAGELAPAAPAFRIDRRMARRLAWLALAGQVVFVAAWVVAEALDPGYSPGKQPIDELAARFAAHPWIAIAGFVALGLSIAALGPALLAVLPRRRASRVAAVLFAVGGAAVVLHAVLPLDCSLSVDQHCRAQWDAGKLSWQSYAHVGAGVLFDLAFVLTPFAIARALWPAPAATLALTCGTSGIVILGAVVVGARGAGGPDGVVQRVGLVPVHVWVLIVAVGILHVAAAEARGALIPVRPRDFFGFAWKGRGEVLGWPPFVYRRFAQGFQFDREVEWLDERTWTAVDRATFDNGLVIRRKMFAEAVADDLVHITADDMPRGADLHLEEAGYRVAPYRLAIPVGPVRFTLRARDEVRARGDGALDWKIHFRWLGLPVGQIHGRVAPVRESDSGR